MKARIIDHCISEGLRTYPIVALTGPRQSGKTTMLQNQLDKYTYVSLESLDTRLFAQEDPRSFLNQYGNYVILDEAQHVPQLFSYIQEKVDSDKIMGQYILSGSQNFNLMQNITQSLAGRVSIYRLMPFDMSEMRNAGWLEGDLSQVMTKGFYPAIFQRGMDHDKFYSNYIETYINRDVSQLKNIQDKSTFKKFIKLLAPRVGTLLNYNDLARDTGISHTTVKDWLNVLETSYIIYTLSPYYKNYSKRLVKSPKLYFYDTGLLSHLLGIRKGNLDPLHPMYGNIFENLVVSEFHKVNYHKDLLRSFYFWQDSNKNEIDLLYHENETTFVTEIKSSKTIKRNFFANLDKFERIALDTLVKKRIVYGGDLDQNQTNYQISSWLHIN